VSGGADLLRGHLVILLIHSRLKRCGRNNKGWNEFTGIEIECLLLHAGTEAPRRCDSKRVAIVF
jgi:hypothetical protein